MHYMDVNKTHEEKAWRQLHNTAASCFEQVLSAATHNVVTVRTLNTHHENYQS